MRKTSSVWLIYKSISKGNEDARYKSNSQRSPFNPMREKRKWSVKRGLPNSFNQIKQNQSAEEWNVHAIYFVFVVFAIQITRNAVKRNVCFVFTIYLNTNK